MLDTQLHDEDARLAALHRLEALDTPKEAPFEKVVALVRTVLSVPMAAVTLVERERQWFKAESGLGTTGTPRSVSFCTHTIQKREPFIVSDAAADPRFSSNPLVVGPPYIGSYAGAPLRTSEGYNVGALCAIDTKPREFTPADIQILTNLASIVMDEMELRLIARRDHLTGAMTRRGFVEEAENELARFHRSGRPATLVLLDVDHFKRINDTHGHPAGDAVLKELAEVCSSLLRPGEAFGRIGGEEFALLFREATEQQGVAAAERFRRAIEARRFAVPGVGAIDVTASFGVAALEPGMTTFNGWLAAADSWLYRAKHAGRNCTRPAAHAA